MAIVTNAAFPSCDAEKPPFGMWPGCACAIEAVESREAKADARRVTDFMTRGV